MMGKGDYNPQSTGEVVDWIMWKDRLQNQQNRLKGHPLQLYAHKEVPTAGHYEEPTAPCAVLGRSLTAG